MQFRCSRVGPLFVMLALVASAAGLMAPPAQAIEYGWVGVEGEEKPTLYLEFRGDELRIAPTPEGLAEAKPVKAVSMRSYDLGEHGTLVSYQFPELDLPIPVEGASSVKADFRLDRSQPRAGRANSPDAVIQPSFFVARFRVVKKGAGDATWTYSFHEVASPGAERDLHEGHTVPFPTFGKTTLAIETKIEGREAAIGLRARTEDGVQVARAAGTGSLVQRVTFLQILKNGKPARASLEVSDSAGKVVHTQKGDLEKFGFT